MKIIVGLGNPGPEYANTRHNAGFMALDRLARRWRLTGAKIKFHAGVLETRIDDQTLMLMQPLTYMNRSGLALGEAAAFYKTPPADCMVVVDDTALPLGHLRLRPGGSGGSHNGLADIQRALGTDAYPRLRIGIGEPRVGTQRIAQKDYVLTPFTPDQLAVLDPALDSAAQAIECWARQGIDAAMNRYNTRAPETGAAPTES
jgi:PTH1 family peptidyl-tRNA hydrolase